VWVREGGIGGSSGASFDYLFCFGALFMLSSIDIHFIIESLRMADNRASAVIPIGMV